MTVKILQPEGRNIEKAHLEQAIKDMESEPIPSTKQLTGTIWLNKLHNRFDLVHKNDEGLFDRIAEISIDEVPV